MELASNQVGVVVVYSNEPNPMLELSICEDMEEALELQKESREGGRYVQILS